MSLRPDVALRGLFACAAASPLRTPQCPSTRWRGEGGKEAVAADAHQLRRHPRSHKHTGVLTPTCTYAPLPAAHACGVRIACGGGGGGPPAAAGESEGRMVYLSVPLPSSNHTHTHTHTQGHAASGECWRVTAPPPLAPRRITAHPALPRSFGQPPIAVTRQHSGVGRPVDRGRRRRGRGRETQVRCWLAAGDRVHEGEARWRSAAAWCFQWPHPRRAFLCHLCVCVCV